MTSPGLFRVETLLARSAQAGPVLGLDTGSPQASSALVSAGAIRAELTCEPSSHCEALPGLVEAVLSRAGREFTALQAVAVGIGPGSFTGLRIGLSYAKGLALALGCALVGISTLDGLAVSALDSAEAKVGRTVCPLLDARRGEVYTALYRVLDGGLEKTSADLVTPLDDLEKQIEDETLFVGQGISVHRESLIAALGPRAIFVDPNRALGAVVAAMAAARSAQGQYDSVMTLQPHYLRPPQAKAAAATVGMEASWSGEKKSSSNSMRPTMKN